MSQAAARKWLAQARHDLTMAERNIEIGGYDIASFLAHHVDELARLLELPDALVAAVSDLNIDYTVARYPDVTELAPFEEYTEDVAIEKVAAARAVFEALLNPERAVAEPVDE
ncbi:hypothetical protein HN371_30040 [Candidatus Poribacteria bacterium]|jgi:HEPN domain-containing protein|nr:hypothetical protein [Candidatus Poribacteria bacterium]MBT5535018.1 hypothetical protein [Candidatus Poribacteria bacterium]MBT5711947.1 hypothetical protein [Candidatus Poribacteria bacterium]MBT7096983.1 hypothetical protein [Candidatus Poribacteria bacterium]MBT7807364.1 hypothetical protein [Candidatus Poribacteria bacterium]